MATTTISRATPTKSLEKRAQERVKMPAMVSWDGCGAIDATDAQLNAMGDKIARGIVRELDPYRIAKHGVDDAVAYVTNELPEVVMHAAQELPGKLYHEVQVLPDTLRHAAQELPGAVQDVLHGHMPHYKH